MHCRLTDLFTELPPAAPGDALELFDRLLTRLPAERARELAALAQARPELHAQVLSLLGRRHADPCARLRRFISEVGTAALGDELSIEAAHLLAEGADVAALERHVEARFGAETARAQRGQIARFCAESLFASLARD